MNQDEKGNIRILVSYFMKFPCDFLKIFCENRHPFLGSKYGLMNDPFASLFTVEVSSMTYHS